MFLNITNANEDITELTFEFEEILSIIKNKFKLKFVKDLYDNSPNNQFSLLFKNIEKFKWIIPGIRKCDILMARMMSRFVGLNPYQYIISLTTSPDCSYFQYYLLHCPRQVLEINFLEV